MGQVNINLFPEEGVPSTGNAPALQKLGSPQLSYYGLAYDSAGTEGMYWQCRAVNFGASNTGINLNFGWHATGIVAAGESGVVWYGAIAAITPNTDTGSMQNKTFAEYSFGSGHAQAGRSGLNNHALTISNIDSLASGDIFFLHFGRSGSHGGDVLVGDAVLLDIQLTYLDN